MSPLQPFGFVDDFPSKFYQKPETTPNKKESNEANFLFTSVLKKHVTERRNLDLINQCRYLAAKKGMSKRELKKSIRKDELEGRNYVLSEEFLASLKEHYHNRDEDESYSSSSKSIDPHGMNFIGGCWHLPSPPPPSPESDDDVSTTLSCPNGPESSEESPAQFVNFTQPNVVISGDKHGESSIIGGSDMEKSSFRNQYNCSKSGDQRPIINGIVPMSRDGSCSRPGTSTLGYFNELYNDGYGSSIEDAELNEYLMETAQFINRLGCCDDNQYCSQDLKEQEQGGKEMRPASSFIHPVRLGSSKETTNFARRGNDDDEEPQVSKRDGKKEECKESGNKREEIALKNYVAYSDDDDRGGVVSDYSTTDETVTQRKKNKNNKPTVAPTRMDSGNNNNTNKNGQAGLGMRRIQILKKSDSSIFGSRDEYGKIVDSNII